MTRLQALVVLLVLCAMGPAGDAWAASQKLRVNDIQVKGHPDVAITVTAPAGLGSRDLPDDAFSVVEGDNAIAPTIERVASDNLDVVVVMDTSGSMQGKPMAAAKSAAADFVRRFPRGTTFSVVGFSSSARTVTGFSPSVGLHRRAIAALEAAGETALYDGLITAAKSLRGRGDGRRAIVLLSDGGDTVSRGSLATAQRQLDRSGASVYAIRYQTAETNSAALDVLAIDGRVIGADSAKALKQVYDTIANELVSQYRLQWTTSARGVTPVEVTVAQGAVAASVTLSMKFPAPPAGGDAVKEPQPAEPVPAPPAREGEEVPTGMAASRIAMLVGAAMFFLGTATLLMLMLRPRRRPVSIMGVRTQPEGLQRSLSELADHAVQAAERGLERRNLTAKLNSSLESAGINLRPAEFLVIVISLALTAFAVGLTTRGTTAGLILAGAVGIIARLFVTIRADRRRAKFGDQLNDTLQLLSGSLRAGYGMMQAIDSVAQEAPEPTAHEFRRLVVEARLGRDMTAALQAMAARLNNVDFEWVVQAILIHREVGGDLAEVLDTVAGTIRERNSIRRQIKALSAEGKLSGIILGIVPPAVGVMIAMVNPGYMNPLFTTTPGRLALGVGLLLMIIGGLWMRKLVKLVF